MSSINFHSGEILGKGELINNNFMLREALRTLLWQLGYGGVDSRGLIAKNTTPIDTYLKVSLGSGQVGGYNTVKINEGWGVGNISDAYIDPVISSTPYTTLNGILKASDSNYYDVFKKNGEDLIQIPNIGSLGLGAIVYVTVYPRLTVFEEGTCSISTSGQVTFSSLGIVEKLRDQNSTSPSKLKFFTNASTPYGSGEVYEVVSKLSDYSVSISGTFSDAVSNLYSSSSP